MAARMKRLTLVRHGQAEWKEATVADFDRPLTRRGLAEAADMARRLRVQEHDPPGLILASPAQRAVQTAEVFARELGLAARLLRRVDSLYLAPPEEIAAAIGATGARIGHLLVVGHNPGLTEFAQSLAPQPGIPFFATGASCTLTFDSDDWRRLGPATQVQYDAPGRFFDLWH